MNTRSLGGVGWAVLIVVAASVFLGSVVMSMWNSRSEQAFQQLDQKIDNQKPREQDSAQVQQGLKEGFKDLQADVNRKLKIWGIVRILYCIGFVLILLKNIGGPALIIAGAALDMYGGGFPWYADAALIVLPAFLLYNWKR